MFTLPSRVNVSGFQLPSVISVKKDEDSKTNKPEEELQDQAANEEAKEDAEDLDELDKQMHGELVDDNIEDEDEAIQQAAKRQKLDPQAPQSKDAAASSQGGTSTTNPKADAIQDAERTRLILSHFTPVQESRYERYKRSRFPTAAIKRILSQITSNANQNAVIVIAGITKMYVGELVEYSRAVMEEWGESGPIQPKHLREAYRRYWRDHGDKKRKFTRV